MFFAYIAGPYRAEHTYQIDRNIRKAKEVGEELALLGFFPIIPHVNTAHMDGIQDDAFWLAGALKLMDRVADLVVLIPGWELSAGTKMEFNLAMQKGIPIFIWPDDYQSLKLYTGYMV